MEGDTQRQISRNRAELDQLQSRMRDVEIATAAIPFLTEDVGEIRRLVEAQDDRHRRETVRAREAAEERAQAFREEEAEKQRLSLTQLGIIFGAIATVLAAIIAAIASLIAAGVL